MAEGPDGQFIAADVQQRVGDQVPFLIALAIGIVLMPLVRRAGEGLGIVDHPGETAASPVEPRSLKIHLRPVSVLGGVGVTLSALAAPALLGNRPSVWLALAALIALGVGLIDDTRSLSPGLRVAGLALAGAALGSGLLRAGYPGWWMAPAVGLALACANGVNLLDGQDGLAGGLGVAAALGLAGLVPVLGVRGPTAVGGGTAIPLALAGGLLAFLCGTARPPACSLGTAGRTRSG